MKKLSNFLSSPRIIALASILFIAPLSISLAQAEETRGSDEKTEMEMKDKKMKEDMKKDAKKASDMKDKKMEKMKKEMSGEERGSKE